MPPLGLPAKVRVKGGPDGPKDSSGCAIVGICCTDGQRINGRDIVKSIALMHDRGNGLGGGFAAYGIYPEHRDRYALHVMYDDAAARARTEQFLAETFEIAHKDLIPTRHVPAIRNRPLFARYFVRPLEATREQYYEMTDDDIVVWAVMHVNVRIDGAFVCSSGKDMGVFKGVGYPEDIAEFFRLEDYQAHTWTAHSRFPTNTTGWWGGAHPFGILDWSVVHNGEISSYGTNRRYLADFGYICALHTDTEVIAYLFDLLIRKHRLSVEAACAAFAPPLWEAIERMDHQQAQVAKAIRMTYGPALLNGPFSICVGFGGGMIALNDRIKLRPMTAARHGARVFVASEESAIREICPRPDRVWQLAAGEPLVVRVDSIPNEYVKSDNRSEALAGSA
ncbi:MAG: glutamine amidotransferase family protein [Phycisphaerae bacterium]